MMHELVLGTVQFGLDYGIANTRGKPSRTELNQILDTASKSGIITLDTSPVYGNAEERIGNWHRENEKTFRIVGKFPRTDPSTVVDHAQKSLKRLGIERFHGYLVHEFESYQDDPSVWDGMRRVRDSGLSEHIGFSLSHTDYLERLLEDGVEFDIVQIPMNLFDQRFVPYLSVLGEKNVQIHIRSIFLQGLIFMPVNRLPELFVPLQNRLERLQELSRARSVPVSALAMSLVRHHPSIHALVIGVDHLENLISNIDSWRLSENLMDLKEELSCFAEKNEEIILPYRWAKYF